MKRYKLKQEIFLVNLYLIIQYFSLFAFAITGSGYFRYVSMFVGIFGVVINVLCRDHDKINSVIGLILILIGVMSVIVVLRDSYNVSNIVFEILVYFNTACILMRKSVNRNVGLFIFYSVSLCIIGGFLISGSMRFLAGMSENSISIILLISLLPYMSTFRDNKETPSMTPMFLCFFLTILSVGRGGILMGALLVLAFCLKTIIDNKHASVLNVAVCFLAGFSIVVIVFFTDLLTPYLYKISSIEDIFSDASRKMIWTEYITQSVKKIQYILFGYPSSMSSIIYSYKNNMHNSFLNTHVLMGLVGLIYIITGLGKGCKYLFQMKNWNLLIFLMVFIVRSFTDWCFPLAMGSIVLYYFMILSVIKPLKKAD